MAKHEDLTTMLRSTGTLTEAVGRQLKSKKELSVDDLISLANSLSALSDTVNEIQFIKYTRET